MSTTCVTTSLNGDLYAQTLRTRTNGCPSGPSLLPLTVMCLSHWMWGCGSLNTRHTNATSLPTTAVWFAGRPACRIGLWGERSGTQSLQRARANQQNIAISCTVIHLIKKKKNTHTQAKHTFKSHLFCASCSFLTNYIQHIGMLKTPVFILHHAGVVPFIRRNHWLHY